MNTLINVNCIKDNKINDILMKNVAIIRLPWMLLDCMKSYGKLMSKIYICKYVNITYWHVLGISLGCTWCKMHQMYVCKKIFIYFSFWISCVDFMTGLCERLGDFKPWGWLDYAFQSYIFCSFTFTLLLLSMI